MHVLAVVEDLLFGSRIREAARAVGIEVVSVRALEAALERCRAEPPALVLLDLDQERLRPLELVRLLRSEAALSGLAIVGFASHVNAERLRSAEAAGCSEVLPRGAFVRALPELLRQAFLAGSAKS
jgi:CheY-like chemotaxis protein